MDDSIDLKIDTTKFDAALKALPDRVSKRYLKSALQASGEVILASMKNLAPERTDAPTPEGNSLPAGILKEDLHTQVVVGDKGGAWVKVGPTEIAGRVCRWQENGWSLTSHGSKAGQKKLKDIPGKHFMVGAMDEAGELAVQAFVDVLAEQLDL